MRSKTSHAFRGALAFGLTVLLSACGGDSPTSPSIQPTPTPPPRPVTSVVAQGAVGGLKPFFLFVVPPFTTTSSGTIDVTVDWTFSTDDVDIYLARGACSFDDFIGRRCSMVAFSESFTAKPEKLSVSGAAAGTYTLLIGNLGPNEESLSYQVTHTSVPGASSASREDGGSPQHVERFIQGVYQR